MRLLHLHRSAPSPVDVGSERVLLLLRRWLLRLLRLSPLLLRQLLLRMHVRIVRIVRERRSKRHERPLLRVRLVMRL